MGLAGGHIPGLNIANPAVLGQSTLGGGAFSESPVPHPSLYYTPAVSATGEAGFHWYPHSPSLMSPQSGSDIEFGSGLINAPNWTPGVNAQQYTTILDPGTPYGGVRKGTVISQEVVESQSTPGCWEVQTSKYELLTAGLVGINTSVQSVTSVVEGKCSFAVGTLVNTLTGKTPIENLRVGDTVIGYDFQTHQKVSTIVARIRSDISVQHRKITTEAGTVVEVTDEHPLYVDGQWSRVASAEAGSSVQRIDGTEDIISSNELIVDSLEVISIDVEPFDTQFVSDILWHNKNQVPGAGNATWGCANFTWIGPSVAGGMPANPGDKTGTYVQSTVEHFGKLPGTVPVDYWWKRGSGTYTQSDVSLLLKGRNRLALTYVGAIPYFLDCSPNKFPVQNGDDVAGVVQARDPLGTPWITPGGYRLSHWDTMHFSGGSGSATPYLKIDHSSVSTALIFGEEDFTIEAWVYITDFRTTGLADDDGNHWSGIISNMSSRHGHTPKYEGWALAFNEHGTIVFNNAGDGGDGTQTSAQILCPTILQEDTWHHIAVCRDSSDDTAVKPLTRLFVDGYNVGQMWDDKDYNETNPIVIGEVYHTHTGYNFLGDLDDVRISKGIARYTGDAEDSQPVHSNPTDEFPIPGEGTGSTGGYAPESEWADPKYDCLISTPEKEDAYQVGQKVGLVRRGSGAVDDGNKQPADLVMDITAIDKTWSTRGGGFRSNCTGWLLTLKNPYITFLQGPPIQSHQYRTIGGAYPNWNITYYPDAIPSYVQTGTRVGYRGRIDPVGFDPSFGAGIYGNAPQERGGRFSHSYAIVYGPFLFQLSMTDYATAKNVSIFGADSSRKWQTSMYANLGYTYDECPGSPRPTQTYTRVDEVVTVGIPPEGYCYSPACAMQFKNGYFSTSLMKPYCHGTNWFWASGGYPASYFQLNGVDQFVSSTSTQYADSPKTWTTYLRRPAADFVYSGWFRTTLTEEAGNVNMDGGTQPVNQGYYNEFTDTYSMDPILNAGWPGTSNAGVALSKEVPLLSIGNDVSGHSLYLTNDAQPTSAQAIDMIKEMSQYFGGEDSNGYVYNTTYPFGDGTPENPLSAVYIEYGQDKLHWLESFGDWKDDGKPVTYGFSQLPKDQQGNVGNEANNFGLDIRPAWFSIGHPNPEYPANEPVINYSDPNIVYAKAPIDDHRRSTLVWAPSTGVHLAYDFGGVRTMTSTSRINQEQWYNFSFAMTTSGGMLFDKHGPVDRGDLRHPPVYQGNPDPRKGPIYILGHPSTNAWSISAQTSMHIYGNIEDVAMFELSEDLGKGKRYIDTLTGQLSCHEQIMDQHNFWPMYGDKGDIIVGALRSAKKSQAGQTRDHIFQYSGITWPATYIDAVIQPHILGGPDGSGPFKVGDQVLVMPTGHKATEGFTREITSIDTGFSGYVRLTFKDTLPADAFIPSESPMYVVNRNQGFAVAPEGTRIGEQFLMDTTRVTLTGFDYKGPGTHTGNPLLCATNIDNESTGLDVWGGYANIQRRVKQWFHWSHGTGYGTGHHPSIDSSLDTLSSYPPGIIGDLTHLYDLAETKPLPEMYFTYKYGGYDFRQFGPEWELEQFKWSGYQGGYKGRPDVSGPGRYPTKCITPADVRKCTDGMHACRDDIDETLGRLGVEGKIMTGPYSETTNWGTEQTYPIFPYDMSRVIADRAEAEGRNIGFWGYDLPGQYPTGDTAWGPYWWPYAFGYDSSGNPIDPGPRGRGGKKDNINEDPGFDDNAAE